MATFKRFLLTALCISILLSFSAFVIFRSLQYEQHKAQVFGHSFGININLYSNARISYMPEYPRYCVTEDGILYVPDDSISANGIRQIGELVPFQLTENNFDLCLVGADWCAYGVDGPMIRSHILSSWKCVTEDGELYFLILQENGDVFLALGEEAETTSIYEIRCLNDVGNEEVFLNTYSN